MSDNREAVVRAMVAERLCQRFADVPKALVHDMVTKGFDELADARVRDFVELLVEREVTEALRTLGQGAQPSISA